MLPLLSVLSQLLKTYIKLSNLRVKLEDPLLLWTKLNQSIHTFSIRLKLWIIKMKLKEMMKRGQMIVSRMRLMTSSSMTHLIRHLLSFHLWLSSSSLFLNHTGQIKSLTNSTNTQLSVRLSRVLKDQIFSVLSHKLLWSA